MSVAECAATDRKCLVVKRLGLGEAALSLKSQREVVEVGGVVRMPIANRGAVDVQ